MAQPEPILFLNHDLTSGGAEHALLSLLRNLDRSRFGPALWVRDRQGELLSRYEELGIDIRQVPQVMSEGPRRRLVWKLPVNAWRLRRFSLVHSFCSNAWWTEPWSVRLAGVRRYLICKTDHYLHGPWRSWEVRQNMASRIVCASESIFNKFYRGTADAVKARIIRNGVDTERFRPQPVSRELRSRFKLPPQAGLFANVANLSPYKGQLQVLVVLASAKARDIPLYVAFAGRDLAQGEMQRWAEQLGVADRALFLGHVENVPGLLAECDGMILLSPSEASSLAVLEAMSCGVPVIATAAGAQELIEHGRSGYCVPTGDIAECVRLMQELHARPELRARVGQAARQRILQHFSLDEMARRYQDLYDEILAAPLSHGHSLFAGAAGPDPIAELTPSSSRPDLAPLPAGATTQPRI
jgi:glycosyltransferase involved in cell wall biosynthesis